jgi:hypothetical protein
VDAIVQAKIRDTAERLKKEAENTGTYLAPEPKSGKEMKEKRGAESAADQL